MFTGLVQTVGRLAAVERTPAGVRLTIDASLLPSPEPGDSVCVSGCCLTLAAPSTPLDAGGLALHFDVVPESIQRTTLGRLAPGSGVNLETSCTPATLLGGHIVQGHVEGLGRVAQIRTDGEWRVRIEAPAELMPCITPKGSITVDGVSLTVAAVEPAERWFEIALIPTTLDRTTLADLRVGEACNLETDILARTVIHYARHYAGGSGALG
ncbi:MAG: riboflavin synthase [Phycisphaerales bacterium]